MMRPRLIKIDFPELRQAVQASPAASSDNRGHWLELGFPTTAIRRRAELMVCSLDKRLDGLRILHVTDLHLRGHWHRAYDELVSTVQKDTPDLILFTGDFVERKWDHRAALPHLRRLLSGLTGRYGIFGILGNHDSDVVQAYAAEQGVRMMTHRRSVVDIGGAEVEIIGLPGLSRADLDLRFIRAQPLPKPGVPRIVLSHYPDLFPAARNLEMDLYLSGHTHGGQVCFPDGSPLITHDALPTRLSKGVHRIGHTWMIVGSGLGFSGPPIRMFCPGETMMLTLRSEAV